MKKLSLVLLPVLLIFAFGLLSFNLMKSHTTQDAAISTVRHPAGVVAAPPPAAGTALMVPGKGLFGRYLQYDLAKQAGNSPDTGGVSLLTAVNDQYSQPALLVQVTQQDISWTPFYAKAALKVEVYYATDGDLSFRHTEPTHFVMTGDSPAVRYHATYTFADVSYGVLSWPAYASHLAAKVTDQVLTGLAAQRKG